MTELDIATLHGSLRDRGLSSMNFLNQIAGEYPDAISFAAGLPYEGFYDPEQLHHYLRLFRAHLEHDLGYEQHEITRTLFQYGRTKGIINDLVARQLATDEHITADPESIVLTVGCQEAMFLVLRALRATEDDVVLAPAPTYVGMTGAARLADLPVHSVRTTESGLDLDDLVASLHALRAAGRRPRAVYVTPDFANPTGVSMTVADRQRLLDIAAREDVLLLEDNAYGLLADERPPTLKSLDRDARVVYLGSFAKTGLPGVRVGFAIADQKVTGGGIFADELSKIKSTLTVNTPPVAQAIVGGRLLDGGGSLVAVNRREIAVYRENLRQVLDGLASRFGGAGAVSWNRPTGGFFVTLTVPFRADDELLAHSARVHGVLWTPMHHFYGGTGGFHQMRLSCSVLTRDQIDVGLDRLAKLFEEVS